MADRTVFLFPGLGAYSTGVLRQAYREYPQIAATFAEIDTVAAQHGVRSVSDALFGPEELTIKQLLARPAELLQLAIFGTSVATHRILTDAGVEPYLLLGHSFGEMAALVCADAFSLADGVRLVCARTVALRDWEGKGAMAAVGANETVVKHLIGLVEEPDLVIGCANAPQQNVIAGPQGAITRAGEAADALGFFFARLNLPYASHHPSMQPAVTEFVRLMAEIRQQPLRRPVFSPIHGRRYTDTDDLRQALADCLILPVRFTDAVRSLHAQGCVNFVEVGALNALTRCVQLTVPSTRSLAPLLVPAEEVSQLRAVADICVHGVAAPAPARPVASSPTRAEAYVVAPLPDPEPIETPAAIPLARNGSTATAPASDDVLERLRELYATALEYPVEVLTPDAALEAELGVDSLKQTALLGKVITEFGLGDEPGELRVWEFRTLGHIADHIAAARQGALR
jgi:[acyl-carrier-protein] S-malonyltransferase